jgi:tetratricopeptide (TPR) repeat protein
VGAITRFGGHVAQYLGDGVLAYFGYPVAREGGAESAIRAGLAIQERIVELAGGCGSVPVGVELRARVGIDTGLVVIGQSLEGSEQDRTAVGDAPNIAARIQSMAEPGTVVTSGRTHGLAEPGFDWQALGTRNVPGVAEPVPLWRVAGERRTESRFDAAAGPLLAPMVGRDLEFATVKAAWDQVLAGRSQAVLLCGEPGIGKSRVLRALRELVRGQGVVPWQYQCSPYYANSDYYPLVAHFERVLKFERDESPEVRLDRVEAMVCGSFGLPQRDANLLARLFGLPAEARYGALGLSPQKQKDETLRVLGDLIRSAGRQKPVLFLFEDAHWADPTTLDAIAAVVARLSEMRVLVVLTHRPEFKAAWSGQPNVTALTLGKLDAGQVAQVVTRVAGGQPLPEALVRQIVAKTDGVPLFVEELTKAILESGMLRKSAQGWELAQPPQELAIPSTLRDSLMARLDRLAPTKETAQIGACIGREFADELLALVSPLPRTELDRTLDQLVGAELVFRRGQGRETVYVFKHALIQDAAYDSLLKSRRTQLHSRIASVLEQRFPEVVASNPEVLAHHYTRAGMPLEATRHWLAAGRLAFNRFALPESVKHLDNALEQVRLIPDAAERARMELEVRAQGGMTWMALGGWFNPNVAKMLEPAWPLARQQGRHDLYVPILWGLSMHALTEGRSRDSIDWVEEMISAAETTGDEDLLMVGHMSGVVCRFWHGDFAGSQRHGDAIRDRYDVARHGHIVGITNHDPLTITGIYESHSWWILGYPVQAAAVSVRKDEHAIARGHWFDIGFAWTLGQWVSEYLGEIEVLEARLAGAERLGIDQGLPFIAHMQVPYNRAMLCSYQSDPLAAVATARQVFALLESMGGHVAAPYIRSRVALALAENGRLAEALAEIDHCIAQVRRPGWEERSHFAEVLRVSAMLRLQANDAQAAETLFRESIDVARQQGAKSWELRTAVSYGRWLATLGKEREAADLVRPVLAWFTEGRETQDLREAQRFLEGLEGGPGVFCPG